MCIIWSLGLGVERNHEKVRILSIVLKEGNDNVDWHKNKIVIVEELLHILLSFPPCCV